MFIEGQGFVKKELVKCFPIEDFTWIDEIFPEEEEDDEWEGEQPEDNPTNQVSVKNLIDVENTNVLKTQKEA